MASSNTVFEDELRSVGLGSSGVRGARELDQLLTQMVTLVRERLGFYAVVVALRRRDQLIRHVATGANLESPEHSRMCQAAQDIPIEAGVMGYAAGCKESTLIPDVSKDPRHLAMEWLPETKAELAVPLLVGDSVLGVLDVQSDTVDGISPVQVRLVEALASTLAIAVHNANLYEDAQRRARQLKLVGEVGRIATSSPDLDHILPAVLDAVHSAFGYAAVAISLVDEASEEVVLTARTPQGGGLEVGHRQKVGVGVAGEVAATGEPMLIEDVRRCDNYVALDDGFLSELCVPLRQGNKVVGVLVFESTRLAGFDGADLELAQTLAEQVVGAISNARAFEKVKRLDKWRNDLMAILVHDLRSPLSASMASLDVLTDTRLGELTDRQKTQLRFARGSLRALAEMIEGILDTHRLEEGHRALTIMPTAATNVVEKGVSTARFLAEVHDVSLRVVLTEELPALAVDPHLCARVVSNLLSNAVKFAPQGSEVTICARRAKDPAFAELQVTDAGEGIPKDEQDRIFDKYAQVESRRAGKKFSTGLGLAFCREAVRAHGGAIRVESELGQGATFFFTLPFVRR